MLTQKLHNAFHVGKNGICIGNFQKNIFFQIFSKKVLQTDYLHSKTIGSNRFLMRHSVHWGIKPSLRNTTLLFLAKPLLNLQTVQAPLLRQSPSILVFHEPPPLKIGFFSEPKNIKVFHS